MDNYRLLKRKQSRPSCLSVAKASYIRTSLQKWGWEKIHDMPNHFNNLSSINEAVSGNALIHKIRIPHLISVVHTHIPADSALHTRADSSSSPPSTWPCDSSVEQPCRAGTAGGWRGSSRSSSSRTQRPNDAPVQPWLARRQIAKRSSSTAVVSDTRPTGAPWRRCRGRACLGWLSPTPTATSTTTPSPTSSSSTATRPPSPSSWTTTAPASSTAPTMSAGRSSRKSSPSGESMRRTWRRAAGWITDSTVMQRKPLTALRPPNRTRRKMTLR